ncbi:cupin domain-containing protein [Planosporangium thailandense]|uniref:Cupin domain-containing protein n=1 Tax=Planosporangium thailandense TaxID=765197 RepID=A0ABX0Y6A8_9ACTN|nr:cupin domain-containing protein [Planosporangium thailandense]NJC73941.1 cupin domain-containing protein [Planosporangium thailandense]
MDLDGALPGKGGPTPEESLGARIREFRLTRRMSLRALATQAQTSPGFLSQLERGQVNASIGTLRKLAEGLGITLPDLFTDVDTSRPRVLRRAERPEIHASTLTSKYLLSQKPLRDLEVYAGEFLPGGDTGDPFTHGDSQEMLVVTAGTVILTLAGVEYPLDVGDSAEYRTSTPHAIRNTGEHPAAVLWIISPPTPDGAP